MKTYISNDLEIAVIVDEKLTFLMFDINTQQMYNKKHVPNTVVIDGKTWAVQPNDGTYHYKLVNDDGSFDNFDVPFIPGMKIMYNDTEMHLGELSSDFQSFVDDYSK